MPTIWYEQGYRFSFFASDGSEPPHIHIFKGGGSAKWWLEEVEEAWSRGFNKAERAAIGRIVRKQREFFLEAWGEFFSA
jgi:hypothetical protein